MAVNLRKPKKVKKSLAKKKAWNAFSLWVRQSNADRNGMVKCYTCRTRAHWKEMDAGHGIGGRNNAVLFMKEVVKPQCKACNIFARGRYRVFTLNLIKELGVKEYEKLIKRSNELFQYKIVDFQEIENLYKERVIKELE